MLARTSFSLLNPYRSSTLCGLAPKYQHACCLTRQHANLHVAQPATCAYSRCVLLFPFSHYTFFFRPSVTQREGSRCWQRGNQRTKGTVTRARARWSATVALTAPRNHPQDRPGRTPRPLRPPATEVVFSSCAPGQHLGPGLVTLHRGPIPSTLRRPECNNGR